ncbi:MAG TPA: glutamine synthetase, partial [Rhodobacteraceae bacterium]|nr:glutamine synthetase [Paracoccaceae bacterium]
GAALWGIENEMSPPAPITGNAYALDLPRMAESWSEAIQAFENSKVVPEFFTPDLIRNFTSTKKQELHYMADLEPNEQLEIYLDTV